MRPWRPAASPISSSGVTLLTSAVRPSCHGDIGGSEDLDAVGNAAVTWDGLDSVALPRLFWSGQQGFLKGDSLGVTEA